MGCGYTLIDILINTLIDILINTLIDILIDQQKEEPKT